MAAKTKPKRYVCEDGTYLAINDRVEGVYIAWYFPEDDDFGGYIGEDPSAPKEPPGDDVAAWENWVAYETVKLHADDKVVQGFRFETMKKAKTALAACNEALSTKSRPWPAWAIQARDAGWTPPEGWKP
jgi:hypothetical protein